MPFTEVEGDVNKQVLDRMVIRSCVSALLNVVDFHMEPSSILPI